MKKQTVRTQKTVVKPTIKLSAEEQKLNRSIDSVDKAQGRLDEWVKVCLENNRADTIERIAEYRKAKGKSNESLRRTVSKVAESLGKNLSLKVGNDKKPAKVSEKAKAKGGVKAKQDKAKADVKQEITQKPVSEAKLVDLFEAQFKAMPTDAQDAIIAHLQEVRDKQAKARAKAA